MRKNNQFIDEFNEIQSSIYTDEIKDWQKSILVCKYCDMYIEYLHNIYLLNIKFICTENEFLFIRYPERFNEELDKIYSD